MALLQSVRTHGHYTLKGNMSVSRSMGKSESLRLDSVDVKWRETASEAYLPVSVTCPPRCSKMALIRGSEYFLRLLMKLDDIGSLSESGVTQPRVPGPRCLTFWVPECLGFFSPLS